MPVFPRPITAIGKLLFSMVYLNFNVANPIKNKYKAYNPKSNYNFLVPPILFAQNDDEKEPLEKLFFFYI